MTLAERILADRCEHVTGNQLLCANCRQSAAAIVEAADRMGDAAEMLWVVLANVSGGDWTKQSQEWQEAAARWRDNYFAALAAAGRPHAETR